jgi:hypothetical protein
VRTQDVPAWVDEYMWGGYLKFLVEQGAVTEQTPPAEVEQMKTEFMSGLRDDSPLD